MARMGLRALPVVPAKPSPVDHPPPSAHRTPYRAPVGGFDDQSFPAGAGSRTFSARPIGVALAAGESALAPAAFAALTA